MAISSVAVKMLRMALNAKRRALTPGSSRDSATETDRDEDGKHLGGYREDIWRHLGGFWELAAPPEARAGFGGLSSQND